MSRAAIISLLPLLALTLISKPASAQSIPGSPRGVQQHLPKPVRSTRQVQSQVRRASHSEITRPLPSAAPPQSTTTSHPSDQLHRTGQLHPLVPFPEGPVNILRPTHLHPHQVLLAPNRPSAQPSSKQRQHRFAPHLSQHHPIQPPPAQLPEANQRPRWKTPYSYGYFGASGTKHWNLHYGYRDRYTEWRLK